MELLFRQPIWEDKKFLDWHYWGVNIEQSGELANVGWLTYKMNVTNPKESQQYIGITNKYNQKLFVGDIVKFRLIRHDFDAPDEKDTWFEYFYDIVEFKDGKYSKSLSDVYYDEDGVLTSFKYCKVVGNIYQNPELLPLDTVGKLSLTSLNADIEDD